MTPPKAGDPSTDPPLARATGWPEKWTAGWRPRNQVFDMRRLWALPLIQAGSRAPQIRPAFAVDLELLLVSDPVASALTSGTGMLGLRPPRSKPPLPPTLAKRARGKESLIVRPPALRADALVSVLPRPAFALGADSLPKLIVAAEGRRAAMELQAWPAMPDGLSGVPLVAPRLRGHIVLAGRVRVELPEAEWGSEAIWVAPEPQPFRSQSAGFGTLRLPPIQFDPPLNGLLALRIYPRSAGSPGEWKRSETPSGIDLRFVGVSIPDSGLQPEKDWIGVGAGCVPLQVPALPANRLPFPGRMDPESSGALPKLPAAGSCRLGLAPIRSVSTRASRMRPLRRGPEARQHQAPIVAVPPEPGFRLRTPIKVRLKVAPKAECLNKPVKPPKRRLKLTLPPIFGPLKKRIRKIPRRTRLGALGLATAAMLALIFWQPSNPGKTQVGSPTRLATRRAAPPKQSPSWFQEFKGKIATRSAVAVTDDFSHGLADWEGRGDWAASWGYDNAGFVRTGPLAIFTPTRVLSDYRMEFVGQIERRSLGWVVRAADLSNYWALRLVVGGTDARPTVTLARYPVIRGVPGRIVERTVDLPLQADTTYRVATDVSGDNYAVTVQGKVADSWTDSRLDRGGVGFFNNKGEQARVRWVGVWHQYDTLGRLCALLSSNSLLGNEREE